MTATLPAAARHDALAQRLADLRAERQQALLETAPPNSGDDADRATNVDAHVRLAMLDQRIADLDFQLLELASDDAPRSETVTIGSVVTVDFGEGPETFLFGSVEFASDGTDVITPASPLGRALNGARVGDTVAYQARPGRTLHVGVIAVD